MSHLPQDRPLIDGVTGKLITTPQEAEREVPVSGPATLVQGTFTRRFLWVYGLLGLLAIAAVAGFLVLVVGGEDTTVTPIARAWSDWSPDGSSYARAQDIADHVSEKYRLASGDQLAAAIAGPPVITSNQPEGSSQILVSTIAITPDLPAGGSSSARDIVLVNGRTSVQYMLCGYGQNCSIAKGEPSVERHTLLRREAMELALFTFRFLPTIDSVSVFLPPRPDNAAAPTMVFLERNDVLSLLGKPFEKSLDPVAPGIGKITPGELALVNQVTSKRLYQYNYTQAQDGSAVMLLDPVVT